MYTYICMYIYICIYVYIGGSARTEGCKCCAGKLTYIIRNHIKEAPPKPVIRGLKNNHRRECTYRGVAGVPQENVSSLIESAHI